MPGPIHDSHRRKSEWHIGWAFSGADRPLHGFVLERGQFVDLGANLIPHGINESGTIVGSGDQGAFFMRRQER
jgi:hypothetical protein